jgi:hypothetical protein
VNRAERRAQVVEPVPPPGAAAAEFNLTQSERETLEASPAVAAEYEQQRQAWAGVSDAEFEALTARAQHKAEQALAPRRTARIARPFARVRVRARRRRSTSSSRRTRSPGREPNEPEPPLGRRPSPRGGA